MTEKRHLPTAPKAGTNRVAARRPWTAPTLTTVEVAEVTAAGGPGTTDSTILS